MKTTIRNLSMVLAVMFTASPLLRANQDSLRICPFQITLVTPLGTNGLQSWNMTNRFSVNLIAGYAQGVRGVELAGFANILGGDMVGIQAAGFCNNTLGSASGLELAGFSNFNHRKLTGLQLAGFANVATDTVDGIQGAGFANITVGNTKGIQAAGFANATTGLHEGLQVSGFVNYTGTLRGVQLGVVNLSDTVERGVPIGFFSWVRHGYKVIQLGGNETLYGEVSFKTGTRRFYNIFTLGSNFVPGNWKWGWGYGIGTIVTLGTRIDLGLEAVSYHINEDYWLTWRLNSLNRLNLSVCYNLTGNIGIYGGASLNVLVSDAAAGDYWQHHWNPDVSVYPGLTGGVRLGWQ